MTQLFTKEYLAETFDFPTINDQQVEAINLAVAWYRGWVARKHRKQIFFLAGYAGTGKTTIAKIIATLCATMDRTMFIAPTGKATSRLRQKGCPGAKTMHQFIYNVRGEDDDGEIIFVAKGALDDDGVKLVVLDEASMVGVYDTDKLTSHRIPILALGDPGQIPPVKAAVYFTPESADYTLETIERNAGNIVKGSMWIRQGKRLPPREYDDVSVRDGVIGDEELLTFTGEDAVVLCSYNNTRKSYNARIRKLLGFTDMRPQVGEKVVCTFNQHGYNIMNGEQGIVIRYEDIPEGSEDSDDAPGMEYVILKSLTDGKERYAKFNPSCFSEDFQTREDSYKCTGGFDYGFCLTIHKSQGSEWLRVLIIEELLRGVPYHQLMYTGVTRAIEYLSIRRYPERRSNMYG